MFDFQSGFHQQKQNNLFIAFLIIKGENKNKMNQTSHYRFTLQIATIKLQIAISGTYYLEYNVSNSKYIRKSKEIANRQNLLEFNENRELSVELKGNQVNEKSLIVTLFVRSTEIQNCNNQFIGKMQIPFSEIIADNKYHTIKQYKLEYCSINAYINIACNYKTSAKLNQSNPKVSKSLQVKRVPFQKKSHPCDVVAEGSLSPPSYPQQLRYQPELKRTASLARSEDEEILVHKASFISQPYFRKVNQEDQTIQHRLKQLEGQDLETLLRQNYRLQRLLYVSRSERKIQSNRHQEEMKDMAREISLMEAQLMRIKQSQENASNRTGQLLDQRQTQIKQIEELEQRLLLEKQTNSQLQQNYSRLEMRINLMKQWESQQKTLKIEIETKVIQNQRLFKLTESLTQKENQLHRLIQQQKLELNLLRQNLQSSQVSNQVSQHSLKAIICEMQEQLRTKSEIVSLCKEYQSRLSELEEKIGSIEQEGFVHRTEYYSMTSEQNNCKIRIQEEIEENQLKKIVEEELEESLVSIEDKVKSSIETKNAQSAQLSKSSSSPFKTQQILTQTTLYETKASSEMELMQLLSKNLQKEYNQLKHMYEQQQNLIVQYQYQRKNSLNQLERMRFQFICELSKVTALVNQKILENKFLKEENISIVAKIERILDQERKCPTCGLIDSEIIKLDQYVAAKGKERNKEKTVPGPFNHQDKMQELQFELMKIEQQKMELSDRCYRLQQQNALLLRFSQEREQLYQLIAGSRVQVDDSKIIVDRFEKGLRYILSHRDKYEQLLHKYGIDQQQLNYLREQISVKDKLIADYQQKVEQYCYFMNISKDTRANTHKKQGNNANLSEIIKNFSATDHFLINQSEVMQESRHQTEGDLLIESTAKENDIIMDNRQNFQNFGELKNLLKAISELHYSRKSQLDFIGSIFQKKADTNLEKLDLYNIIQFKSNRIKSLFLESCSSGTAKTQAISIFKDLERSLQELVSI